VIPIQKRDSDKLHKYIMTITGDKTVQLQIAHQHPLVTHPIEEEKFNTEDNMVGSDKQIGVRQIGIWSNSDYARHIYLFVDLGDNNWHQWVHWTDKGQYTAIVRKVVSGTFKNPPPYHFFPYDEEDAVSSIKLLGDIKANSTWCRQINSEAKATMELIYIKETVDGKEITKAEKPKEGDKLLWDSDDTLKHNNTKIVSGTYANDDLANTILFASAIDADKQQAFFGIKDMDAIWTGIDSRWYVNHHVIDSDVINSRIDFNLLMGAADEIRIQLGNRTMDGWILDNDYAFGGYEFVINREGKVWVRIEYFYGLQENGRSHISAYSLADNLGIISDFNPTDELKISTSIRNIEDEKVLGSLFVIKKDNLVPRAFTKIWTKKDWHVNEADIPKGRVDSKELLSLYMGSKMHWGIGRVRTNNRTDNGSLINKIRVYKL
jgi:hypothetical protein